MNNIFFMTKGLIPRTIDKLFPLRKYPIFQNSIPKSGTHLLKNILLHMRPELRLSKYGEIKPYHFDKNRVGYDRIKGELDKGNFAILKDQSVNGKRLQSEDEWKRTIHQAHYKNLIIGHIAYKDSIVQILNSRKIHKIFLYRDPRDIVISRAHYMYRTTGSISSRPVSIYFSMIEDFHERVRICIEGNHNFPEEHILHRNIRDTYSDWLGWLEDESVLSIKYEELTSDEDQKRLSILNRIASHCNVSKNEKLIQRMKNAYDIKPETFRKGNQGAWKTDLSPENRQLFKDICGDLLIHLGYESSNDW